MSASSTFPKVLTRDCGLVGLVFGSVFVRRWEVRVGHDRAVVIDIELEDLLSTNAVFGFFCVNDVALNRKAIDRGKNFIPAAEKMVVCICATSEYKVATFMLSTSSSKPIQV